MSIPECFVFVRTGKHAGQDPKEIIETKCEQASKHGGEFTWAFSVSGNPETEYKRLRELVKRAGPEPPVLICIAADYDRKDYVDPTDEPCTVSDAYGLWDGEPRRAEVSMDDPNSGKSGITDYALICELDKGPDGPASDMQPIESEPVVYGKCLFLHEDGSIDCDKKLAFQKTTAPVVYMGDETRDFRKFEIYVRARLKKPYIVCYDMNKRDALLKEIEATRAKDR